MLRRIYGGNRRFATIYPACAKIPRRVTARVTTSAISLLSGARTVLAEINTYEQDAAMLTKYYVESGRYLRVIVLATDALDAMLKAFTLEQDEDRPLRLADLVIVNERGFVWDRDNHELYGDEFVLPTELLLGASEDAR
jgi:hypothetical protein